MVHLEFCKIRRGEGVVGGVFIFKSLFSVRKFGKEKEKPGWTGNC